MKAIEDFSKYKGKISNSGHDERNRYHGGKAGDQTGTEWYIRSWYNRPWNVVIRFADIKIAYMIATLSIYAAQNNRVGYDQYQRTTYWTALKRAGYDPRKITSACEDDCSAGVLSNVKAALILTGHESWASRINVNGYTGNMRQIIRNCGARVLTYTDASHCKGTHYLRPGDILLNTSAHTAVNLGWGSHMTPPSYEKEDDKPAEKVDMKKKCVKELQRALNKSYGLSLKVDGDFGKHSKAAVDDHYLYYNKKKPIYNEHVGWLQENLCSAGFIIDVDKSFGPRTDAALRSFQKKYGLAVDGCAGVKTHSKMISLK